jgi:hypothetical protein
MKDYLRMKFKNGEVKDVAVEIIASNRANYIANEETVTKGIKEYNKVFEEEYEHTMEDAHIVIEWAKEHVAWDDIRMYAVRMEPSDNSTKVNYEKEWKENLSVVYH